MGSRKTVHKCSVCKKRVATIYLAGNAFSKNKNAWVCSHCIEKIENIPANGIQLSETSIPCKYCGLVRSVGIRSTDRTDIDGVNVITSNEMICSKCLPVVQKEAALILDRCLKLSAENKYREALKIQEKMEKFLIKKLRVKKTNVNSSTT